MQRLSSGFRRIGGETSEHGDIGVPHSFYLAFLGHRMRHSRRGLPLVRQRLPADLYPFRTLRAVGKGGSLRPSHDIVQPVRPLHHAMYACRAGVGQGS